MKRYQPLTASRIKNTQPTGNDVWLSDDSGVRGIGRLLIRITPSGVKRFYFRYTDQNSRKTIPLGPYSRTRKDGFLTIEQARVAARAHGQRLPGGRSEAPTSQEPFKAEQSKTSSPPAPTTVSKSFTVLDLCHMYVAKLKHEKRTSTSQVSNAFKLYVEPHPLAAVQAQDATATQFTSLLREIVQKGYGRTAGRLRSYLHAAYSSAIRSKLDPSDIYTSQEVELTANPLSSIPSLSEQSKPGERALRKSELAALWSLLNPPNKPTQLAHRVVRLNLLLGGQRCRQLVRVTLSNVNLEEDLILLHDPKGRRSRPREHWLPLVPGAKKDVEWFSELARNLGSTYLFAGSDVTKSLHAEFVTKAVKSISDELLASTLISTPFSYADLRRTIETTLASLGVLKEIRAQIQSHGLSGVQTRHYDRYEYREEKKQALLKWEAHLASLPRLVIVQK
jgi:integrase